MIRNGAPGPRRAFPRDTFVAPGAAAGGQGALPVAALDAGCRRASRAWTRSVDPFWNDAIERGDENAVRGLIERGADVNARDRHGQTGLMLAAHAGRREVVEVLLEHRPALDVAAKFGLSALMLAVVAGHVEIARLLDRAGCDLSARASGAPGFANKTAGDLAAERGMHELASQLRPRP